MAENRGGLPLPRVQDTTLNAWITAVSARLGEIDRLANEADRLAKVAQSTADRAADTARPVAPTDLRPAEPTSIDPPLRAVAGIGVVALFWPNPFTVYRNHGLTRVYRHTADEFNNATELGQSSGISYVDRQVVGNTDYYYWIVWESQAGNDSNPSDGVEVTPAVDPAVAIEALSDQIRNDPLTRDLLTGFSSASLQQLISERTNDLYAFVLETIRDAALDVEAAAREALGVRVTGLEASVSSPLGPAQNTFTGADRDAAEAAVDTYAAANPTWLGMYDANPGISIRLDWS